MDTHEKIVYIINYQYWERSWGDGILFLYSSVCKSVYQETPGNLNHHINNTNIHR